MYNGEFKGSYALGIMFRDFPDEIFAVRKDSPLIVGVGEHENFIASDVPAIIHYTRDYYLLDQNEIAVIKKDSVKIYDVHGEFLARIVCVEPEGRLILDRKSTRLNSSHRSQSRMPSSA